MKYGQDERHSGTWQNGPRRSGLVALLVVFACCLVWQPGTLAQAPTAGSGKIMGTVIDAGTGEPLIGATIAVDKTALGAISDLDGKFIILPTKWTTPVPVTGWSISFWVRMH